MAAAVARARVLARHVVRAGMIGARRMEVLARLAIHSSLTHVLFFSLLFYSLLWSLYDTLRYLRYFTVLLREGKVDLFSSCFLVADSGLKTLRRLMHVLKPKTNCVHDWI